MGKSDPTLRDEAVEPFYSLFGYKISFFDDEWQLDKDIKISFITINRFFDDGLVFSYKKVMQYYAMHHAATYVNIINCRIEHYLNTIEDSGFSVELLVRYRSLLTERTEWYLAVIRGFIKRWYQLGYYGVTDDVIILLDNWRLKGNRKGEVVKLLSPDRGPLTDFELSSFIDEASFLYEKGIITIQEYAMVLLLSTTGRRPIQLSHMQIKDVFWGKNQQLETETFIINIPRAKQRGQEFRGSFKTFAIMKSIWQVVARQCQSVQNLIQKQFNRNLTDNHILCAPLFLNLDAFDKVKCIQEYENTINTDRLHIQTNDFTKTVKKICRKGNLISDRTKGPMMLTANRFRYTIGTRAAREGYGVLVIAELLDHTDTQNAHVYVENIPDYARNISDAVNQSLGPYATLFKGKVILNETKATRGDDKTSRIKLDSTEGLGSCASYGFCKGRVPLPCYTCPYFQPWRDAPHEKVMKILLQERDRVFQNTRDNAVASVNDRTIEAVKEVMLLCREMKNNEQN